MKKNFVHLNIHTQYSIVDSTIRVPELMQSCVSSEFPAVTITDQNNVFGMVKFYRKALDFGIKPIVGCDLFIANPDDEKRHDHLIILCKNNLGYKNLTRLITKSWLDGQTHFGPRLHKEWLDKNNCEGLIALSGGVRGDIGRSLLNGHHDLSARLLESWQALFGDRFYIELNRTNRNQEENYINEAIHLADNFSVPVVATNDVRFLSKDDFHAHEARVCIQNGTILSDSNRKKSYSEDQYMKTPSEISDLFSDIPEAISNTVEIAKRCNLNLDLGKSFLPVFPIPNNNSAENYLETLSHSGLKALMRKKSNTLSDHEQTKYKQRLNEELDVINKMGFASYFLIVSDFIDWAKTNDIPVGPGRGSGAGSLVAFALGITNIDPLQYDLLFERFLNQERVSMPDFDVDFCMDGRDRVIDYVASKYGSEKVSQIITYGTMAARAVIRDVGRVLDQPYGFVDKIAKQVPFEVGMTLEKAIEQDEELRGMYESDEEVQAIIDLAKSLEGLIRNAGKHAGGVVIAPDNLTDFTPLYCEENQLNLVTQFDKDDVEAAGLVKFDFLGLRTLTVINLTLDSLKIDNQMSKLDVNDIPLDDEETFKMLRACNTTAIFQLESRGMRDLIKRMQPDQFEDLIALVALFRPGPLESGMVHDFIYRKHQNNVSIDYFHPKLQPILEETYGVILYQEQVMQIAQVLAGYSLGSADILRRAMGKKKVEEMAEQRQIFINGSEKRDVSVKTASYIFDLMEKFAGYGFNKSHSAAYAMIAYQTAYLKAHHTPYFLAAVMTAEIDNTDRIIMIREDCSNYQIDIVRPSINRSGYGFSVLSNHEILYGLGAIKGVGKSTVESIISEREDYGNYTSLNDFCRRLEKERINRRVLEALIKSGAMDDFGLSRNDLSLSLDDAIKTSDQSARDAAAGQEDMFGMVENIVQQASKKRKTTEWDELTLLKKEKESLGLYLSGHPFKFVKEHSSQFTNGSLKEICSKNPPSIDENQYQAKQKDVVVSGLISDIKKRGNRITVTLDDSSARMDVVFFKESYFKNREFLRKDEIILVDGKLRFDQFSSSWQVNAEKVRMIDDVIESKARILTIELDENHNYLLIEKIKNTLSASEQGECQVAINYENSSAIGRVELGNDWKILPTNKLRKDLEELIGKNSFNLSY